MRKPDKAGREAKDTKTAHRAGPTADNALRRTKPVKTGTTEKEQQERGQCLGSLSTYIDVGTWEKDTYLGYNLGHESWITEKRLGLNLRRRGNMCMGTYLGDKSLGLNPPGMLTQKGRETSTMANTLCTDKKSKAIALMQSASIT